MSTTAIFDADMATLARWVQVGFEWWVGELRALVPSWLRRRLSPGPAVVARYDGQRIALSRRGLAIERGQGALAVALVLPFGTVLVRDVHLPVLGLADLQRLVDLDAERLLPFAPGTALIDFMTGTPGDDGLQPVTVAGLPLAAANSAITAAVAEGLDVRQLCIDSSGGVPAFDFMPAWRRAAALPIDISRRIWWGIVGLGFLLNLAVMIGRDVHDLGETRALIEAHGQTAATARLLRGRVVNEDARRRGLIDRRIAHNPLPVLAETTRELPDSVWVQRLSWNGAQLRIAGYKPGNIDAVAAMRRAPIFVEVRNSATDVPAQSALGQPFEITAERRR